MKLFKTSAISCCLFGVVAWSAHALDTCDVDFYLDDAGPFSLVAFSVDYAAAGGDFVGDSSYPGFGPSWGTELLACTSFVGAVNETTLLDDNGADLLSVLLFDVDGGIAGASTILSCVLALDSGFPCPPPSAFTITDPVFPDDPMPVEIVFPPTPSITVSVTARAPVCGDGFVEGSEECDDGNTDDGDCCSSGCLFDAAGTPCPDASVCTVDDTCDGAGTCAPASVLDCDDGIFCTHDYCDDVLGCQSVNEPTPHTSNECSALHGKLDIRDNATADKLKVKATLSGTTLGDPTDDTTYAVCVWDEQSDTSTLAFSVVVPPGPAWKEIGNGKGFKYKDSAGTNDGVQKVKLKKKKKGGIKLTVLGRGDSLPLPGPVGASQYLHADSTVTLQIENDSGQCWTLPFGEEPRVNRADRFKIKD
jgi:cysteine-rich repeat protein